ncbi:hypothetical protein [Candidatus Lariskella endosymbiont of Epinotia ramella]|uniref:hypothetical protein n=1 Tax=Candidatus Lariskella endosymbiont of Epinotia ramella TaxID=3066224 RepID=UPI0030CE234F
MLSLIKSRILINLYGYARGLLSPFRDDKLSPFHEQIDSICSFEGLNEIGRN